MEHRNEADFVHEYNLRHRIGAQQAGSLRACAITKSDVTIRVDESRSRRQLESADKNRAKAITRSVEDSRSLSTSAEHAKLKAGAHSTCHAAQSVSLL